MISYIVASHHYPTLRDNLGATVRGVGGDEIVLVENAASIAAAYNEGQARATQPIRCYIHHDVQVTNSRRLRQSLVEACTPAVGMVGVIGSRDWTWPWWDGDTLGSVVDARFGVLDAGPGGECAALDGLLLATVHDVAWDETIPGWHGYDFDACAQMRPLPNWCLTGGMELVYHNTQGPTSVAELAGWDSVTELLTQKWGARLGSG